MKVLDDQETTIQDKIRAFVNSHRGNMEVAQAFWQIDLLMMEAADRIDELEERIAIMNEDQYKSSEIRFP